MTTMGNGQWAVGSGVTAEPSQRRSAAAPRLPAAESRGPKGLQLPLISPNEIDAAASGWDRPPEQTHYRDEGCRFWSACLSCPFTRCLFEEPGGARQALNAARDGEIRQLFAAGERAVDIAERFGVSRRTVYRILGGQRHRGRSNRQSALGSREPGSKRRSHLPRREQSRLPTADCPLPRD